jgi:hypothetical protein
MFDFFCCLIFVNRGISDVDWLECMGWTKFGYINFLCHLTESEPALKVFCVCLCACLTLRLPN